MVFNLAARQALGTVARSSVTSRVQMLSLPRTLLAPASIRSLATPPSSSSSSKSPSSSKSATDSPASTAEANAQIAPSQEPELNARKSSSIFDIDTSASPLASQLIETDEKASSSGPDKTGAKAKTGARSMSSIERRRQHTVRLLVGFVFIGAGLSAYNLGRPWDNEAEADRFKNQSGNDNFLGRIKLRLNAMYEDFNKPVFDQLLPDPLPFPYSRPFTMVIDLDDLLVHSEWSREHGWRTAKRPGVDHFLGYLSQFYEIVLFTTQPFYTAAPIIEKLDPDRRFITYTLFRESCRNVDGKLVKDLNHLNRDLRKVIVVDTNPDSFYLHPQNGIVVQAWKGDPTDRELIGLIPFFEAIGIYYTDDVRTTIQAYSGTHIATEHARRAAEIRQREIAEKKARAQRLGKFGSLFGGVSRNPNAALPLDKTIYDLERQRYVQAYLDDQNYWKENGDAIRRQAKEEQDRQIREMKINTWGFFTSGMKPNPPSPPSQPETDSAKQP